MRHSFTKYNDYRLYISVQKRQKIQHYENTKYASTNTNKCKGKYTQSLEIQITNTNTNTNKCKVPLCAKVFEQGPAGLLSVCLTLQKKQTAHCTLHSLYHTTHCTPPCEQLY